MALKKRINQSEYAVLEDSMKSLYVKEGPGYKLDLEGDDAVTQADVDAAIEAKNHEKRKRQEAEQKLKDAEADGSTAASLRTQVDDLTARLNSRDEAIKSSARELFASDITKHAKRPKVLLPHVLSRLSVDLDDQGRAVVTILGADGKPSAMKADDLVEEYRKSEDFKDDMLGPSSSGGGGGQPAGGAPATKELKDMTETERVAMSKSDPEAFKKLVAASGAAV